MTRRRVSIRNRRLWQRSVRCVSPWSGSEGVVVARPGDWQFGESEAHQFGQYVRSQLPFYDLATSAVADLCACYLPVGGRVVDIGAGEGNIGRAIGPLLESRRSSLVAVEPSEAMRAAYDGPGVVSAESAESFEVGSADVIVSFLTLQFVSPAARTDLVARWVESLRPGGALIVVERVVVESAALTCRFLVQSAKARAGAEWASVVAKELSLAGVLRPIPTDLLPAVGGVLFFAFGDFRGYLVEAEG